MHRIIKYVKPHIPFFIIAIAVLFLQAFCDLSLPNIMAQLVNMILRTIGNGPDLEAGSTGALMAGSGISPLGLRMLLVTLTGGGAAIGVSFMFNRIAAGIARDLRHAVFEKVESFSSKEFDDFSTASLITRCTNDISNVQGIFSQGVRMIFYAPIMGIGGVFMAVRNASTMSWIIVTAVVVLLGMMGLLISIVLPRFRLIQQLLDKMNRIARETLGGLMVIRAFSAQKYDQDRFDDVNRDLAGNQLFVNRTMSLQMPMMQFIQNVAILIIMWFGAQRIAAYTMEVGDMMAFIQYTIQIIFSFMFISNIFIMLPRASVSAERIAAVLEKDVSIKDPAEPQTLGPAGGPRGCRIEFRDVSFHYQDAQEEALSRISFSAEPDQTTAIIGATGSGKSSIVNLILRFYDVSQGSITLNGIDIRHLSQRDLRSRIGYVPQKSILLSGPLSFNLRYGKIDAAEEEVWEGASIAQARDFIQAMEGGMEAFLAQAGANVSGGQKQRLSIARALVRDPEVLIFDDSFSALDFATDARLREALEDKKKSITKIIVAQRVGTIMQAEKIIVLDKGIIVGMGTHDDLMESCQEYREIAESQIEAQTQEAL